MVSSFGLLCQLLLGGYWMASPVREVGSVVRDEVEQENDAGSEEDRLKARYLRLQECKTRMIANGWCSHHVDFLARTYDLETFAYFSGLRSQRPESHEGCKQFQSCIAYNVDAKTYRTRHTTEDCICEDVATPYEKLIQILRGGGVPLVTVDRGVLKVRKRKRKSRYIAISHVWADGLGNTSRCAIPRCRLEQIYGAVSTLIKRLPVDSTVWNRVGLTPKINVPLFWMDTLCIPVQKEHQSLRLAQIDKMGSIYTGAQDALVMDAELMASSLDNRVDEDALGREMYAKLLCSVWNQRSWTYHEAVLAPRIAMHLAHAAVLELGSGAILNSPGLDPARTVDGSVDPTHPVGIASGLQSSSQGPDRLEVDAISAATASHNGSVDNQEQEICGLESSDRLPALREKCFNSWALHSKNDLDFASVWNELCGRSTTLPQDMPLIISNILDFQNYKLLEYAEHHEMYQAILLSADIPLSIFSNLGPRCAIQGQQWIPTSVDKEPLRSRARLTVHRKYFSILYHRTSSGRTSTQRIGNRTSKRRLASDIDNCFSVYIVKTEDVHPPRTSIALSDNDGAIHVINQKDFDLPHTTSGRSAATCIILEAEEESSVWPPTRRASYFTVVESHTASIWRTHRPQILTLDFEGPLRAYRILDHQRSSPVYQEPRAPVDGPLELRISYERLSNVHPLHSKRTVDMWAAVDILTVFACFSLIFIVAAACIIWEHYHKPSITMFFVLFGTVFFSLEICLHIMIIGPVVLKSTGNPLRGPLQPWIDWWHVRSFEKLLRRRKVDGELEGEEGA